MKGEGVLFAPKTAKSEIESPFDWLRASLDDVIGITYGTFRKGAKVTIIKPRVAKITSRDTDTSNLFSKDSKHVIWRKVFSPHAKNEEKKSTSSLFFTHNKRLSCFSSQSP